MTLLLGRDIPGPNGIEFTAGSGWHPVINKDGEIALAAAVKSADGPTRSGAFFRDQEGNLRKIILPGEDLPDGGKVGDAAVFSINDAGMVTFVTSPPGSMVFGQPQGFRNTSAYLWEKGTITPVAVVGQKLAEGSGVIVTVSGAWLNEQNRSILVSLVSSSTGRHNLYRFADGKLNPVVVTGQKLQDGLAFLTLPSAPQVLRNVSNGNAAGQHAFAAQTTTGPVTLYLLEADGSLSVVLKPQLVTNLGMIDFLPDGIGLNNNGQISVPVAVLPSNDSDLPYAGLGVLTPVPSSGAAGR